jgi:hypothetical protein
MLNEINEFELSESAIPMRGSFKPSGGLVSFMICIGPFPLIW